MSKVEKKQKLTNLKLSNIDAVYDGAQLDADISIKKSNEEGQEVKEDIVTRIAKSVGEYVEKVMEKFQPVAKQGETSFDDEMIKVEASDELKDIAWFVRWNMWDYEYALRTAIDNTILSTAPNKKELITISLEQFSTRVMSLIETMDQNSIIKSTATDEQVGNIQKSKEEIEKVLATLQSSMSGEEAQKINEVVEKAVSPLTKQLEDIQKENEALKIEKTRNEFIQKAKDEYGNIPVEPSVLGGLLSEASKSLASEQFEILKSILSASNKTSTIEKSLETIGKNTAEIEKSKNKQEASENIQKAAREVMATDKNMTLSDAIAIVEKDKKYTHDFNLYYGN